MGGPYDRPMKRTHPAFWGAGWAGLAVGALLTAAGLFSSADTAQLAGGYGLMLAGSAVYLLGGLGLRETLARRSRRGEERQSVGRLPGSVSTASQG